MRMILQYIYFKTMIRMTKRVKCDRSTHQTKKGILKQHFQPGSMNQQGPTSPTVRQVNPTNQSSQSASLASLKKIRTRVVTLHINIARHPIRCLIQLD